MTRRALSATQEDEVIEAYRAGETFREIAARYGCSDPAIRNVLLRREEPTRSTKASLALRSPWKPQVEDEAIALYREGWSVHQLAKRWSVRTKVISDLLAERSEPLHPGGRAHPRFRSAQQCQEVAAVYVTGASLADLAEQFETSTPVVTAAIKRAGVEIRPSGRGAFWTEERLRWVSDQYLSGRSPEVIAEGLGCKRFVVVARLRQTGAIPPPARPTGADVGGWQGGRCVTPDGYVWARPRADDLEFCRANSNGYVIEHRLVVGRALGRRLTKHETVHHINGDRSDNRLENLQLRQGRHGKGVVMICCACGSHDVKAVEIAT